MFRHGRPTASRWRSSATSWFIRKPCQCAMANKNVTQDVRVPLPGFLRAQPEGTLLSVKLQPRASKNEIGEPLGDELRIKVTAPPVDAAANQALVEFLA